MKRIVRAVLGSLAVGGLFLAAMVDSPAVAEGEKNDGKAIFLAQKCNTCHAVPSVGIEATTKSEAMKGPDIKGISVDAEKLGQYLRKKAQIDGKDHKKEYKGDDDKLKVLIDWVLEQ
jgi:cytochrome c2